jgi:small subunit ribosomal protein S7
MPRRRVVAKREVLPDPLFNSQLVTKFVNVVMRDGKKTVAEKILYQALESIRQKTSDDPMKVFKKAVENVKPSVEVKSRRVGGSNYQGSRRGAAVQAARPLHALDHPERRKAR